MFKGKNKRRSGANELLSMVFTSRVPCRVLAAETCAGQKRQQLSFFKIAK